MRVNVKPLSVNAAFQGRRYKTKAYKDYERILLLLLPSIKVSPNKRLRIFFTFGFSNVNCDLDNPTKLILDIMQKKYKFNDSHVWQIISTKEKTAKGKEFIDFHIEELSAVATN